MGQDKPKGSVMVVGGGIAGIQAALSLAGAGYGVHLIERTPSLGGMIPNLHRIYPLCACCKLDPRVSACEQDPNINVMLDTTVLDISGDTGNFSVTVKTANDKKPLIPVLLSLRPGSNPLIQQNMTHIPMDPFPMCLPAWSMNRARNPLGLGKAF